MMKKMIQDGFSIIELMVAILLGSILLLGVMQVMITSSNLGAVTNNLAENQDKAKTILGLLGGDAQRAGYIGCSVSDHLVEWSGYEDSKWRYAAAMAPITATTSAGSNNFGIRFNYGLDENVVNTAGSTALKATKKSCLGKALYYRSVAYTNCKKNDVEGLCVQSTNNPGSNTGLADEFIPNVSLDKITFVVKDTNNNFKEYIINGTGADSAKKPSDFSQLTNANQADLLNAELITFYVTVKTATPGGSTEAIESIDRSYSATYPLKNKGS